MLFWQPHFHPFNVHKNPSLATIYFYVVNILLGNLSDKIIAITPREKKLLSKWFPPNKIVLVVNPVESKRSDEDSKSNHQKRNCSTINGKYVLVIGRNEFSKRLNLVTSLAHELLKLGYQTVIVTNNKTGLKGDFIHYSNCDNATLCRLYENAECVAIPSLYEAFSLVAVEAAMHGKMIICRDNLGAASLTALKPFCVFCDFSKQSFLKSFQEVVAAKDTLHLNIDLIKKEFTLSAYSQKWLKLIAE